MAYVPPILESVLDSLSSETRLEFTGAWACHKEAWWALPVRATLSVLASKHMPLTTDWYVVFHPSTCSVAIYPSKDGGITATFQHQTFNAPGNDAFPWRLGNPCLSRQMATFGRDHWTGEPEAIEGKIVWYLERLLAWIDAAATEMLAVPGEPLELPAARGRLGFPVVGFQGADDDLAFWPARRNEWGWADLARLPMAKDTYAVLAFRDQKLEPILDRKWGAIIAAVKPSTTGLWIALDRLPVLAPWELPRTWSALADYLKGEGVDLEEMMVQAGIERRRRTKDGSPLTLLLGFPISKTIGEQPSRFHWLAIGNVELSHRKTKQNGFRISETGWRTIDRLRPLANAELTWRRTVNWEPEELRTRSGPSYTKASKSVMMLGAGSLGSAVAENLVRMGVTDIGIMDGDQLDIGNLTRHGLGMDAVGHNKALALAQALNGLMPDANATGIASNFPPTGQAVEQIRRYDTVLDCTGSDAVLASMAAFDWGGEKTFVSMAMTWRAEGLLVYTASEAAFPALDAKSRFAELDTPPSDPEEAGIEGIGCWHPVFPATAADVRLWSSVAAKAVMRAIESPVRRCDYFRQSEDGTLERIDG